MNETARDPIPTRGMHRLKALIILVGGLGAFLLCACEKSAAQINAELDAKVKASNKADRDQRDRAAAAAQAKPPDKPSSGPGYGCPVTAARAMEKMRSCGLNMDGISAESLCSKMDMTHLSFLASRTCPEIGSILSDSP